MFSYHPDLINVLHILRGYSLFLLMFQVSKRLTCLVWLGLFLQTHIVTNDFLEDQKLCFEANWCHPAWSPRISVTMPQEFWTHILTLLFDFKDTCSCSFDSKNILNPRLLIRIVSTQTNFPARECVLEWIPLSQLNPLINFLYSIIKPFPKNVDCWNFFDLDQFFSM